MSHRRYRQPSPAMVGIALIAAIAVAGCGTAATGGTRSAGTASTAPSTPTVQLQVASPSDGDSVQQDVIHVRGTVTAGATVNIDGRAARVQGANFVGTTYVPGTGDHTVQVTASRAGYNDGTQSLTVTRELSDAEKQQQAADFKAAAQTIPYSQLNKDAAAHAGAKVVYRGQILQIQEDPSGGGIMLLSVTDDGYGLWSDNIWVNYAGKVKSAEKDLITVYGTVKGSRSYDTQIGGNTYVPEIDAKYIDEAG